MAQTWSEITRTAIGNLRLVILNFDANGTGSGSYSVGLQGIHAAWTQNTEKDAEEIDIQINSNDGTIGSSPGDVYVTAPDGTNNTGYIFVIGW